jgi:YgiT-type zinc finger domain-containing protein
MKYLNCKCENQKREKITKKIPIGGTIVLVENAPARVCQDCGEIYFDGKYLLELEKNSHSVNRNRRKLRHQTA